MYLAFIQKTEWNKFFSKELTPKTAIQQLNDLNNFHLYNLDDDTNIKQLCIDHNNGSLSEMYSFTIVINESEFKQILNELQEEEDAKKDVDFFNELSLVLMMMALSGKPTITQEELFANHQK